MDYSTMLQAQEQAPFQGVAAAPVATPQEQSLLQSPPPQEQQQPGFFEKLRTNPALAQAALMMGARMMMGPKPGQDALGVLGESMMIGNHTFTMGKQNEVENEQNAQRTDADTKRVKAVTAEVEQKTAQDAAAFPGLLEKTQADIVRLRAAGKVEEAKAIALAYQNDPKRLAEMYGLDVAKAKAEINLRGAQAGAASANADESRAGAERKRDEIKDPSKYRGVGNNAALTRSTFLPQLLNAASKQLADLENSDLTRAEKAQQRKELTAEINGYKAEMKDMGDAATAAAKGGKGAPAPALSSGSSAPAGSFAAMSAPPSSTTMPAVPGTTPAPKVLRTMTMKEVQAQATAKGKTLQEALDRAKALDVTITD